MLGPIMIHNKKTFTTYKLFASCLVTENRELQGLHALVRRTWVSTRSNSSECINFVLKVKLDYKRNEMTVLVNKICELIEDQQFEVEKALLGTGKYTLHPRGWVYLKKKGSKCQKIKGNNN